MRVKGIWRRVGLMVLRDDWKRGGLGGVCWMICKGLDAGGQVGGGTAV